jgi:hypothetical protein
MVSLLELWTDKGSAIPNTHKSLSIAKIFLSGPLVSALTAYNADIY